jgi:hypothetical protein
MSEKIVMTSEQAITVLRNLANHQELRFLNLSEFQTVVLALNTLEKAIAPTDKPEGN